MYLRQNISSSGSIKRSRTATSLVYQHCFPGNSPLLSSPFFPMSSTQHAALPGPLATVFHSMKKTNFDATALSFLTRPPNLVFPPHDAPAHLQLINTRFAMVWAASFFFLKAEALSLVNLRTSSLPALLSKRKHAFRSYFSFLFRCALTCSTSTMTPFHQFTQFFPNSSPLICISRSWFFSLSPFCTPSIIPLLSTCTLMRPITFLRRH